MKTMPAVFVVALVVCGADKPRVFITESGATVMTGESEVAGTKGSLSLTGGSSPQSIEVMKAFAKLCPAVVVTGNREKADYLVRFDHEGVNPTTPFVRGNKVAVFDRKDDLVYSNSSRLLAPGVKGACAAITAREKR